MQKSLHNSAFACKDDNVSTENEKQEKESLDDVKGAIDTIENNIDSLNKENDKVAAKNDEYDAKVGEAAQRDAGWYDLLSEEHSVHYISQDSTSFTNGVSITSIRMAKGLEFDEVIIPDVDNRNYDSDYDRNLLYIACTRAMHKLTLFYTGSPSPFLPEQDAVME